MLKLDSIVKEYVSGEGPYLALKGITLNIDRGDFIIDYGPSGCGKSTLLNIIGLMDFQSSGEYYFHNQKIRDCSEKELAQLRNSKMGFVFQSFFLLKDLNVWENIALPLGYAGIKKEVRKSAALDVLDRLKIKQFAFRYPSELSGGQKQRVAIARGIINKPEIIIADEPTGNLDSTNSKIVMEIFSNLSKEGNTIIMSTHNLSLLTYGNRVIEMNDGEFVKETII